MRSRSSTGQHRPNLRTPLLPSFCGPPPDVRHIPSHRQRSSITQACCWRASVAFRLPTRSQKQWRVTEKTRLGLSETSNDWQRTAHYHRHIACTWILAHGRVASSCSLQTRPLAHVCDTHPFLHRHPSRQRVCCRVRSHSQVFPQRYGAKTFASRQAASRRPDRRARAVVRRGVRLKCPEATNPTTISIHEGLPRVENQAPLLHSKPMRFVSRRRTMLRNRPARNQRARERAFLKLAQSTNSVAEPIVSAAPKSQRWWSLGNSVSSLRRIYRNLPMAVTTTA